MLLRLPLSLLLLGVTLSLAHPEPLPEPQNGKESSMGPWMSYIFHKFEDTSLPVDYAAQKYSRGRTLASETYVERMGNYSAFAAASYCTIKVGKWDCGSACTGPSIGMVPTFTFNRESSIGYVGYNERIQRIIVSFRGTYSVRQMLTDLQMHRTPFPLAAAYHGRVHKGFYLNYELVREDVLGEIARLIKLFPTFPIIVTGHSLGGAIATLMAAGIYEAFPTTPIFTFTYGTPRVGDAPLAQYLNSIPIHLVNIVYGADMFAHTPPPGLQYVHAGRELWIHNSTEGVLQYEWCGTREAGEDLQCSRQVRQELWNSVDHRGYWIGSPQCDDGVVAGESDGDTVPLAGGAGGTPVGVEPYHLKNVVKEKVQQTRKYSYRDWIKEKLGLTTAADYLPIGSVMRPNRAQRKAFKTEIKRIEAASKDREALESRTWSYKPRAHYGPRTVTTKEDETHWRQSTWAYVEDESYFAGFPAPEPMYITEKVHDLDRNRTFIRVFLEGSVLAQNETTTTTTLLLTAPAPAPASPSTEGNSNNDDGEE